MGGFGFIGYFGSMPKAQAMKSRLVPSKKTIQDSFHSKSTKKTYASYQKQFAKFCEARGASASTASSDLCTDFFHSLVEKGRTTRTIQAAKTALVSFFKDIGASPNPAQDTGTKRYVVGLKKYNKKYDVDDEKKAHPMSFGELSTIMDALAKLHPFVRSMYRFLLSGCFLGCFRISEMLMLRWNDVSRGVLDIPKGTRSFCGKLEDVSF